MTTVKPTTQMLDDFDKVRFTKNKVYHRSMAIYGVILWAGIVASMINHWYDTYRRFTCFEHLADVGAMTYILIEQGFFPERGSLLNYLLHVDYYKYSDIELSSEKKKLIDEEKQSRLRLGKFIRYSLFTVLFSDILFLSLLISVYEITKTGWGNVMFVDLKLPFEFYIPYKSWPILSYCVFYVLDCLFIYSSFLSLILIFVLSTVSMNKICTELDLFEVSLTEIKDLIHQQTIYNNRKVMGSIGEEYFTHYEKKMIKYFKEMVQHHQLILRKVAMLNKGTELTNYIINQAICFALCVTLYACVESDTLLLKVKAYAMLIPALGIDYILSASGQRVIDKSENIRQAMYHCAWLDMPIWFRKSLTIMMTCANRPLTVKLVGIYVMDNRMYTMFINAAYSYFNLLRSFKK